MKRILLTTLLVCCSMMAMAQTPSLHQLYWSEGSITLDDETKMEGLTSYYPNVDVIFFKKKNDHQIKTFHISQIASLRFFDNGMRTDREFVKLRMSHKDEKELYELIHVNNFVVLRVPSSSNYQYDPRSRQYMDQQNQYSNYRYWIAMEHPTKGLAMMPRQQANKLIAYIKTDDLDCYSLEDQAQMQAYYENKIGDKLARKMQDNLITFSAD